MTKGLRTFLQAGFALIAIFSVAVDCKAGKLADAHRSIVCNQAQECVKGLVHKIGRSSDPIGAKLDTSLVLRAFPKRVARLTNGDPDAMKMALRISDDLHYWKSYILHVKTAIERSNRRDRERPDKYYKYIRKSIGRVKALCPNLVIPHFKNMR
ncbi:hypothetical protein ACFL2Q_08755 [Thermodesulfobacteriota bacterium]